MLVVRDMLAFINRWNGAFYSECAGLRYQAENDPTVLDEPVYLYATAGRLVFTTVENDRDGLVGSSFIAILNGID